MRKCYLLVIAAVLAFAVNGFGCTAPPPNGADAAPTIENELWSGRDAVLCAGQTYNISTVINYPDPPLRTDVAVYTEGYPTDGTRALLRLFNPSHTNLGLVVQAEGFGQHGAKLLNVRVDGGSQTYGFCNPLQPGGCGASIAFGGASSGQRVEWVETKYPRGWSSLQVKDVWSPESGYPDRCIGAIVRNNTAGPSGSWPINSYNPVKLADGLSIGCMDSFVENNTINDATDVGIAIFGSPGTRFANNVININNVRSIAGITMSDLWSPGDPDNSDTVVESNSIIVGCSAYCPIGISMGRRMAACSEPNFSHGARVKNNFVWGRVGYAYAMAGVYWWEATGNLYYPGGVFCGLDGAPASACVMPGASVKAFVMEPGYTTGRPDCGTACFQPEFVNDSKLAGSNPRVF